MPAERSKKLRERLDLARRIELCGIEMSPCSYCEKQERKCLVAEGSSRCSECARRGQRCDVEGIPASSWVALEREEERLDAEEEKAAATMAESAARLARLRKQKKFLHKRAAEMLRRGLKTLDELDELDKAEEKERKEKEEAERFAEQTAAPSASDMSGDLLADPARYSGVTFGADFAASPSFWDSLGFVNGTASKDPDS
jgi:hypothetical protein